MNIFDGNFIRKKQHVIMVLLYMLRGATNEQIRRYLYSHLNSKRETQLSYVSRFISKLKEYKLVKSISCHPLSKEEINFLSKKGVEYIHTFCRIERNGFDKSVGFSVDGPFRSFEYDILSPPQQYLEHHLMSVDVIVDHKRFGQFRNNLYCVKKYHYIELNASYGYKRKAKLKPDGELLTNKGYLLAVEVDTGTERFDKLLEKYSNYRKYFDYCIEHDLEIPWLGILFHTKKGDEKLNIEDDKRWQTILKAAIEGLSHYCWKVDVFGFNRTSLKYLLIKEPDRFKRLGFEFPSKENPIIKKKKEIEEKKRQEEIRKQREIEEFLRREQEKEQLFQRREEIRLEQERIAETERREKEKKKSIFGWLNKGLF